MKIHGLNANNLRNFSTEISTEHSVGIGGLSGSGKSTFCSTVFHESRRRIISLLPKSEYRFLFSEQMISNCFASDIQEMPLIFYLKKNLGGLNPRSTIGTHTGLYKHIRIRFAQEFKKPSVFFSFNNSFLWCPKCRGRGMNAGIECGICHGSRYHEDINEYKITVQGRQYSIVDINHMTMEELLPLSDVLGLDKTDIHKIQNIINLGLPYLSMDRIMGTLSGGETMRVLLAEFMAFCHGALLILDEVSTGLDRHSLLQVLNQLKALGTNNQIWFIDHSDLVLASTEQKLYFGPGSGADGGCIVEQSPRPKPVSPPRDNSQVEKYYHFENLNKRNLSISTLDIPKGKITAISGESGCGKSTLVHDCIVPYLKKHNKSVDIILIGQDRNQSITSKSTIASFLDIKKHIEKLDANYQHASIQTLIEHSGKNTLWSKSLRILNELGLGYLQVDRKIQTLSGGEFQGVHLVANLHKFNAHETIIVMDEPSKGLSQNILNKLMHHIREIQQTYAVTFLIIEHNEYILNSCDFIANFGQRTTEKITELPVVDVQDWKPMQFQEQQSKPMVYSNIDSPSFGIEYITEDVDRRYKGYECCFKGGILKNYSSTAQWVYKDYVANKLSPVVAIDFEKKLYSEHTFFFETASIIGAIMRQSGKTELGQFDYYDINNLCSCCKGTAEIESFDLNIVVNNPDTGLWDGLLKDDVMKELKRYNYSKIKFLFKEIKKESGLDLSKPYSKMSQKEKTVFLYGYWDNVFYDTTKKTQRRWYGILHLIKKYMKSSTSPLKAAIKAGKYVKTCPICHGTLLNHNQPLEICGYDIRELIQFPLSQVTSIFQCVPQLGKLSHGLNDDYKLNQDVSSFPLEDQVYLKCLELCYAGLSGFCFAFKNLKPYLSRVKLLLKQLSEHNQVILLDWNGMDITKDNLLEIIDTKKSLFSKSYVYEILGYKTLKRDINAIHKKYFCPYCGGKKVIQEKDMFEGVDVTEIPCESCGQTGISKVGMNQSICGRTVQQWLNDRVGDIVLDVPEPVRNIPLNKKIKDLNKYQISEIYQWWVK